MAEIPTMECSQCGGSGCAWEPPAPACGFCDGTGRIPRQPLTPDEIAALPDGARVAVEYKDGQIESMEPVPIVLRGIAYLARRGLARVWLAEEVE